MLIQFLKLFTVQHFVYICGLLFIDAKFVEEMCSVFDKGCRFVNERFEMVVNELRNALCGMTVTRYNGTSWIALFVNFR